MKQIQQSERRLPTASHRDPVGTVEARQVGPSSAVPPELSPLSQANELFARASPNRSTRSLQGLPPGWKDTTAQHRGDTTLGKPWVFRRVAEFAHERANARLPRAATSAFASSREPAGR
jgi:hypothetical protein